MFKGFAFKSKNSLSSVSSTLPLNGERDVNKTCTKDYFDDDDDEDLTNKQTSYDQDEDDPLDNFM